MAELTTSALAPDTTAGPLHYPLTTIWGPQGIPCYGHILAATSTSPESCIPPHFSQVMNNHGRWENGYYSPGICPWGYSIGCTPTGPSVLGKPIYPSETVGLCVPISWGCRWDSFRSEDPEPSVIWATPHSGYSGLMPQSPDGSDVTNIRVIEVRWKSSDLSILETTPVLSWLPITSESGASPSKSNVSPAVSTTPITSDEIPPSNSPSPSSVPNTELSTGLSKGAIAGIAVGAVLLALLFIAVVMFWIRRRNLQARDGSLTEAGSDGIYEKDSAQTAEMDTERIAEMDTEPMAEMDTALTAEMDSETTWTNHSSSETEGTGGATSSYHSSPRQGTADPIPIATMVEMDASPREPAQGHGLGVQPRASIER